MKVQFLEVWYLLNTFKYPFSQSFNDSCQSSSMRSIFVGINTSQVTYWREPYILDSHMCISSSFYPHPELAASVIRVPSESRESVKGGPREDYIVSNSCSGRELKFFTKKSLDTRSWIIIKEEISPILQNLFHLQEFEQKYHYKLWKSSSLISSRLTCNSKIDIHGEYNFQDI